jgi:hypothetical protein
MSLPTLIQRVQRRTYESEHSKGIDRLFEFDYMGSSEFEFNTVPKALKAMRAAKDESWRVRPIMAHGVTCYHVGGSFNEAVQVFDEELKERAERKYRPLEWTYIRETFFPERKSALGPFNGWWALDAEVPFILFKDRKHAEEFLALL